jgi:hypothetical protein
VKSTFEVYILEKELQLIVLIERKNTAHPKFSGKNDMAQSPKLLDQVRDKLRVKHYAIRTEQSYVDWIKRYIYFHDKPGLVQLVGLR